MLLIFMLLVGGVLSRIETQGSGLHQLAGNIYLRIILEITSATERLRIVSSGKMEMEDHCAAGRS